MNLTTFVLSSFSLIVQQYSDNYRAQDLSKTLKELEGDYGLPKTQEYDFIVVGAGTAGCLLAGRLSEMGHSVLLLEKGGDPPPPTFSPRFLKETEEHKEINDFYYSTLQHFGNADAELTPKIMRVTAGKMMGGSGSHNWLGYNRGSPHDYDNWANLTNDSSWSFENMLQHFKRFENNRGFLLNETSRNEFYGAGGPFTFETQGHGTPYFDTWFQAGEELGYLAYDANAFQKEAFSPWQTFSKAGVRESTYTAFVKPFENKRESLVIHRYSPVEKVLIDSSKRAYGVTYKRHGMPQIALAKKEIIVSAGSLASPFLLMKSGVGPKDLLGKMKVPLIRDLPGVGENLQDHVMVYINFKANSGLFPLPMSDKDLLGLLRDFHKNVSANANVGLATGDLGMQAHLVSERAKKDGEANWPDYQIQLVTERLDLSTSLGAIALMRQKSKGKLLINTTAFLNGETEVSKLVQLDLHVFEDQTDIDVIIEGVEFFLKVIEKTEAFSSKNLSLSTVFPESCSFFPPRSKQFWKCFITQDVRTVWHVGGTCKMGVESDPTAVLDSKLRVLGLKGLRVVDASVLPVLTNSNINGAVMAIAEKASQDMFKEYE